MAVPDPQVVRLFINHGAGGFEDVTLSAGLTNSTSLPMGMQIGDINNDGFLDILLGNGGPPGGQPDNLYINMFEPQTGPFFVEQSRMMDYPAPEEPNANPPYPSYPYRGHGTFFGDVDNDGDLDLLVGNGGPYSIRPDVKPYPWCQAGVGCCASFSGCRPNVEPNRLFRNDGGNTKNWLSIKLIGVVSNRNAIGARVKVTSSIKGSNIRTQFKVIQGGSGFNSNNPFDVHIGLWDDDTIHAIEVTWPSGLTQSFTGVGINQRIVIKEGDPSIQWSVVSGQWSVVSGFSLSTVHWSLPVEGRAR